MHFSLCLVFGATRLKNKTKNPNPAAFGLCFGSWKFLTRRRILTKRRGRLTHKKEEKSHEKEKSHKPLLLFEDLFAVG